MRPCWESNSLCLRLDDGRVRHSTGKRIETQKVSVMCMSWLFVLGLIEERWEEEEEEEENSKICSMKSRRMSKKSSLVSSWKKYRKHKNRTCSTKDKFDRSFRLFEQIKWTVNDRSQSACLRQSLVFNLMIKDFMSGLSFRFCFIENDRKRKEHSSIEQVRLDFCADEQTLKTKSKTKRLIDWKSFLCFFFFQHFLLLSSMKRKTKKYWKL